LLAQKNFCREWRGFPQIIKEKFAQIRAIRGYGFVFPLKTVELF